MSTLAPVSPRERIAVVDVLRGLALCGVLIGNLFELYSGNWALHGRGPAAAVNESAIDTAATWIISLFVSSKAQTTLTFLFGFGFAAQLLRAEERREPVTALYVRRMLALFALGALHVVLLWWGDVTWGYAIAGFGLLPFTRASNRTRVIAAFALVVIPFTVCSVPSIGGWLRGLFVDRDEFRAATESLVAAMKGSDRAALTWNHVRYALMWSAGIAAWYPAWLVGRFLFGYVAGAQRWFDADGAGHLPLFRKLLAGGLIVGAAASAVQITGTLGVFSPRALPLPVSLALTVLLQLGLLALAAAYIALTVLLIQRPGWRRVLCLVAPAGRMPLSIYFTQSAICTFLCYGFGLGWAGKLGAAACLGLALAIFALQAVAATLWLRRFRFGPLEWVWRTLVYGRPPAMRAD